jgi:DnaA family protein
MRQLALALGPEPRCDFDAYVPGANAAALQHLRDFAMPAAPQYLWGPSGSGKTHLLRALAGRCAAVAWFDAASPLPWVPAADCALVVVDGCEALDAAAQHAAFALFVEAAGQGVQFAAAGRLPPVDLPLRDDLRTRLGWGDVHALRPLAEAETRTVLERRARHRGIELPDEVTDHLLTRFDRDLGHLVPLLDRLDGYAMVHGRRVTLPLLRQMLAEPAAEPQRDEVSTA